MTPYRVEISAKAEADVLDIARYIANKSSLATAERYVGRILAFCRRLDVAPLRGTSRDDLGAGLRTLGFERRATILFQVLTDERRVVILGVYFAGRQVR